MKNLWDKFINFFNSWTGTFIIVFVIIFFIAQAFVIPSGSMKNTLLIGDNLFVKKYSYGIPTPTLPWVNWKVLPDFNNNGHLIEGKRPQRGDIVIFLYPKNPQVHYVKRNVAISGDEVIYTKDGLWIAFSKENPYSKDSNKSLQYNGKTFYFEPYVKKHPGVHYEGDIDAFSQLVFLYKNGQEIAMQPILLDDNESAFHYVVKEDEFFMMGDNRNNSEDSRFWGAVEYRHVVGKPWIIYFSWDDDFKIRWDRIGKSVESLEEKEIKKLQKGESTQKNLKEKDK